VNYRGSLWLDVITSRSPAPIADVSQLLKPGQYPGARLLKSQDGVAVLEYETDSRENDESIHSWMWEMANVVDGRLCRIGFLSFAVPESLRADRDVEALVALFRQEAANVTFLGRQAFEDAD
jgi:hypothetical protein